MTQERWDEYTDFRRWAGQTSTLKAHLDLMLSLVKNHGMGMGANATVPNFDHVVVPLCERSRRWETLTEEEFEAVVQSLIEFHGSTRDVARTGSYQRDFRFMHTNRRVTAIELKIDQANEKEFAEYCSIARDGAYGVRDAPTRSSGDRDKA